MGNLSQDVAFSLSRIQSLEEVVQPTSIYLYLTVPQL